MPTAAEYRWWADDVEAIAHRAEAANDAVLLAWRAGPTTGGRVSVELTGGIESIAGLVTQVIGTLGELAAACRQRAAVCEAYTAALAEHTGAIAQRPGRPAPWAEAGP